MKRIIWACILVLFLLGGFSLALADVTISTVDKWNLIGARLTVDIKNSPFNDKDKFLSLWKWVTGQQATWAVFLPENTDGGTAYATAKGFQVLSGLAPGDGFWVNSKGAQSITLTGTETIVDKYQLTYSWNLKGLSFSKDISVSDTFGYSALYASVWAWDTSANPPTWAVYLPGQDTAAYAGQKGFSVLSTIKPGQGFWVNVKEAQGATANLPVEVPPVVGKVSELAGTGDKGSYKPVANASVYANNNLVGKTDSQGKFTIENFSENSVTIKVDAEGYISFNEKLDVPSSKQIYVFLQKQDPNKVVIEGTESLGKLQSNKFSNQLLSGYYQKPTPKTITSSDKTTSVTVSNMKLEKDITASVTPFKALNVIPDIGAPENYGLIGQISPIGGASVDLVDSKGNAITSDDAGFSGTVTVKTHKVVGKYKIDEIDTKVKEGGFEIYLLAKGKTGWYLVGPGKIESKDSEKNLTSEQGFTLKKLESFVFILLAKGPSTQTQLVKGKVKDKDSGEGIGGVYVSIDGFPEQTITGGQGNYELNLTIMDPEVLNAKYLYLLAWKDGYYAEYLPVLVSDIKSGKEIDVSMKPFGDMVVISGYVKDANTGNSIENAVVTLKTPTVLDQMTSNENGITVGKNENATYKWTVYDDTYTDVLKTLEVQGKNSLSKDELVGLVDMSDKEYAFLFIELKVSISGQGTEGFSESAIGWAMLTKMSGSVTLWIEMSPDFGSTPYFEAWTDQGGKYEFYGIPKSLIQYLKVFAKAKGYFSSAFEALSGTGSAIIKDIALTPKPQTVPFKDDFESGAGGWTKQVLVDGVDTSNTNVSWTLLSNPEAVTVTNKVMDILSKGIVQWVDVTGTVGDIYLDTQMSSEFYKVYTSTVTYYDGSQQKVIGINMLDSSPDTPGYDTFWVSDPTNYTSYIWWDFSKYNVNDDGSYPIGKGTELMISYQKQAESKPVTLPPAYSGNHIYWFGNLKEEQYKGTYYDSSQSGKKVEGILTSPQIDLTNFDSPTFTMQTWYETSGTTHASMLVEIAVVDENLGAEDTVTIESTWGSPVKLKKGEFVPLNQLNFYLLYPGFTGAMFGADADKDGIPDMFEMEDLDPQADADGDGLSNLAEFVAGTNMYPSYSDETLVFWPISSADYEDISTLTWQPVEINLQPFAKHKVQLRFRFIYKNLPGSLFRGWGIDDVELKEMESWYPFQLLVPEYGFSGSLETSVNEGTSWAGSYTFKLQDIIITDMSTNEQTSMADVEDQVSVTQSGQYLNFEFDAFGNTFVVEGNFSDVSYKDLSFWLYDKETSGYNLNGKGYALDEGGNKTGTLYFYDYVNLESYSGTFSLIPQP